MLEAIKDNEIVETCPLEDYIIFNHKTMPMFCIIHGGVQKGKSTLFHTLANNIVLLESNYTEEWDYKKYCARNLEELIDKVDLYDNAVLGYEETTRELNTTEWYSKFNQLCSELLETQGYKKNIIFFVQPVGLTIPNRERRMVNLGIEVLAKNETSKTVLWRNTIYEFQNWRLDESFIWYNHLLGLTTMTYTDEQLRKAKEFTDWLIEAKKVMLKGIKERVKNINSLSFEVKDYKIENKHIEIKLHETIKPLF